MKLRIEKFIIIIITIIFLSSQGCTERKLPNDDFTKKWEDIIDSTKNSTQSNVNTSKPYNAEDCVASIYFDENDKSNDTIKKLPKLPITLDIRKPIPVETVLKILAQTGKTSIIFNAPDSTQSIQTKQNISILGQQQDQVPPQTQITNERKINLTVYDAPWDEVFFSVLNTQGLTYRCEGNIIRVMSLNDLEHINKIEEAKRSSEKSYGTGVFRLQYADVNDIKQTIADFLGAKIFGTPYGGEKISEKSSESSGEGSAGVLSIIREDQQKKSDEDADEVGKDMMYSRVIIDQLSNSIIVRARQEDLQKTKKLIQCLDKPRKKILITAYIIKTTRSIARELGIQWGWNLKGWQNTTPITLGNGRGGISGNTSYGVNLPAPSAATNAGAFSGVGAAGNLLFGSLDGNYLEAQLSALDVDGKVNILSSPTIVTLDNQGGYIANGLEVPYQKSVSSTGQTEVSYEFKQAVLKLEIVPRVIDERTIKLKIAVTDNSVDRGAQIEKLDEVASIRTRETETVMTVTNNQTIVISGLTETTDDLKESGVPGLKDVPGIGWLGKNQKKEKSMDQLMVFIRPTIIN